MVTITPPMEIDGVELSIIDVQEIVPGHLTKHIVKRGEGSYPTSGQMCKMHYTGVLSSDKSKFDSSRDRNEPFEFTVGVGQVIKGWDSGVVTMSKGEECVFEISADYGYGSTGAGASIPPNAGLMFHVELLDFFDKPKEMYEMSHSEKMAFADEKKSEGNAALREKKYSVAQAYYQEGVRAFEDDENQELEEKDKVLKVALHNNLTIALNHTGNYLEAALVAAKVLQVDPSNVKATYNRANALGKSLEYQHAINTVKSVLERDDITDDNKKMFQRQLAQLKQENAEQEKKERSLYGKMFK